MVVSCIFSYIIELSLLVKTTDPKNLVTLDYSVVKALDYNVDSVDIFLKVFPTPSNVLYLPLLMF